MSSASGRDGVNPTLLTSWPGQQHSEASVCVYVGQPTARGPKTLRPMRSVFMAMTVYDENIGSRTTGIGPGFDHYRGVSVSIFENDYGDYQSRQSDAGSVAHSLDIGGPTKPFCDSVYSEAGWLRLAWYSAFGEPPILI